jgi:hypothetical protein
LYRRNNERARRIVFVEKEMAQRKMSGVRAEEAGVRAEVRA